MTACNTMAARLRRTCLLCLLVTALLIPTAQAELATDAQMEQVCTNWLAYSVAQSDSWHGVTNPRIAGTQEIVVGDTVLGIVYNIDPGGYVVVPVLKELPPVKMYSEHSYLDMTDSDGSAALIREVLQHRLTMYSEFYGDLEASQPDDGEVMFDRSNRQAWDRYTKPSEQFTESLSDGRLTLRGQGGPLLTTTWDQGAPYNELCPMGSSGRCPVGCVATAAAQILAYWQWPPEGTGEHTYWWNGDGGSGAWLYADYSDPYDWENIPDYCPSNGPAEQRAALSELNYEVGVAFNMNYASDGSGAYTMDAAWVFPTYFKYKTFTEVKYRSSHTPVQWFDFIKEEVNAGRPMEYRISGHAIVCDGWRDDGDFDQYHFNYGWDDGHNAWYIVDNLYCPWDGCDYMVESMVTHIEPDLGARFTSDIQVGWVPFDVEFQGESEWDVDQWIWDFGDGDSAWADTVVHTYTAPGLYDVRMEVHSGGDVYYCNKPAYIAALADSLYADTVPATGSVIEVTVFAVNNIPLQELEIPVQFVGDLDIDPYSVTWSTEGCRTADLDYQEQVQFNPAYGQMAFRLGNYGYSSDLAAGSGPVLRLFFPLDSPPAEGAQVVINFEGYSTYEATFVGELATYQPLLFEGLIGEPGCCVGIRGNIDNDTGQTIDITDLIELVGYMFQEGPEPGCMDEANIDGDALGTIDIADLIALVGYMFQEGPPPADCN